MTAVRLVYERGALAGGAEALTGVREAIRESMPQHAEVRLCLTGPGEIMAEALVSTYEERQAALHVMRTGTASGHRFHAVTDGLEHGGRRRHRGCGILDS